jgi:hypothetical protein
VTRVVELPTPGPQDPAGERPGAQGAGAVPACEAPGCTNPGGAFTAERGGRIYEFCSETCRAKFEST